MKHDLLLKTIFYSLGAKVIPHLCGCEAAEFLSAEFPGGGKRIPDIVARLADGRILHVEVQTLNDPAMVWRMLEYWLLLAQRYPDQEIEQFVLYIGPAVLNMPGVSDNGTAPTLMRMSRTSGGSMLTSSSPAGYRRNACSHCCAGMARVPRTFELF